MPQPQSPTPDKGPSSPASGAAPAPQALEAGRRAADAARAQAETTARDTQEVIERTADATRDAARAQREILQRNVETAQDAVRSGLEAGAQGLHTLTDSLSRRFVVMRPNPELAAQSARNIRAVSEASTELARGAQEASSAWFDLVQNGVRSNLEAVAELTSCRTMQDLVALQSRLTRDNLRRAIEAGEQITQACGRAIAQASRAIQAQGEGAAARA